MEKTRVAGGEPFGAGLSRGCRGVCTGGGAAGVQPRIKALNSSRAPDSRIHASPRRYFRFF
ncbi:MAG: hypothetical protein GY859_30300 [Desulfobacterales bacterium]|nr:hypothetical protein [Desulfobacterales bacterium]